jgi:transcriptional regulator with XRE-family HTH domain
MLGVRMNKSPNPIDKYVGSRIRMRRLMLRISQTDLANALGVTFQQVQKYEKGANRVSASRLQQIAVFLGVSVPFFFEDLPDSSRKANRGADISRTSEFLSTREAVALVRAFMAIKSQKLRHSVVQLIEEIADAVD